ncbi:MAG: DUF5615 family PIN-like protein [Chloroflexota bacterium]
MRFLLDENTEYRISIWLRGQGHDVTAVAVDYRPSLNDPAVLALGLAERRIIITNDTDFGELVFAQHLPHAGVILFRLGDADVPEKCARLAEALSLIEPDFTEFLVIDLGGSRLRRSSRS